MDLRSDGTIIPSTILIALVLLVVLDGTSNKSISKTDVGLSRCLFIRKVLQTYKKNKNGEETNNNIKIQSRNMNRDESRRIAINRDILSRRRDCIAIISRFIAIIVAIRRDAQCAMINIVSVVVMLLYLLACIAIYISYVIIYYMFIYIYVISFFLFHMFGWMYEVVVHTATCGAPEVILSGRIGKKTIFHFTFLFSWSDRQDRFLYHN